MNRLREALALIGILVMTAGIWQVHWPSALVFVGAIMTFTAVRGAQSPPSQLPAEPSAGEPHAARQE